MSRNVRLLFAKELLGAVRDRRTLLLSVIFPLIFYPLVLAVMGRFTSAEAPQLEGVPVVVALVQADEDTTLREAMDDAYGIRFVASASVDDALRRLEDHRAHAAWVVDLKQSSRALSGSLYYDSSDPSAVIAAGRVRALLAGYAALSVRDRLGQQGLDYDEIAPSVAVDTVDVAAGESVARMILSRLLPYFLVLAILTGAMSFGAEITAGEKERGTIATLLVSHLSRTQIVIGKFLSVLTVSLVSSLLSAVGLMIGLRFFGSGLSASGPTTSLGGFSLGATQLAGILVTLVPLAVVISALVIIVGSFARSQKEASTYLIPVYMVIVLVGLASMTGASSIAGTRFLIPVANALFVLQEIIVGELPLLHLGYTFAANAAVGIALVAASIFLFRREAILFRS